MLVADANGRVAGKFTVPPNIIAGTKTIEVRGANGGRGTALYTGQAGTMTVESRRQVTTTVTQFYDPLAQTFTPDTGFHCAGVDLFFQAVGNSGAPVDVQLRDVENGYPGTEILAQCRVPAAQLARTPGASTRFLFGNPTWVDPNIERCFVVMTDDPNHAIYLAQLGKGDLNGKGFVTKQPYNVGVMFASSNGKAWSAFQDQDLQFGLLRADFTSNQRTVALGNINAAGMTDLLMIAGVQRPTPDAQLIFTFTRADGSQFSVAEGQTVSLGESVNEVIACSAQFAGKPGVSPILFPNPQVILGVLRATGLYHTRAFAVGNNGRITITYECNLPGTASILADVQTGADPTLEASWTNVGIAPSGQRPVGDGWVERTHIIDPITIAQSRIRLRVAGSALYRPQGRNFRAVVSDKLVA
jgi:hypothetical protein